MPEVITRLNLGCNTRIRPGYVNIDKDKYPGVDVVGDVSKLDYPDSSIDEIYASHILEHFPHPYTISVLTEWRRVLKDGGVLKLSVPDFRRTIEIYLAGGMTDWVVNYLWGDQGYNGANHYTGFDELRLVSYLQKVGFTDISRVDELPGSTNDECSNNVYYMDNMPVSINMICVK